MTDMDDSTNLLVDATKRVGATLRGKYTIEALLGIGGMAAVYRAKHRNGHRVAVKILHPSAAAASDVRARFLREGYVANTVEHPGAVRVTDDDTADDGSVFLVMELLDGETVEALWERAGERLAARDVAILAWHLLDVLVAAHAKGIIHRDVKPDNLFITRQGTLKVLDFGIARLVDAFSGAATTHTGRMVGTPAFMAPEQALGQSRDIDARTDLWSVGATMFLLASGKYVHDADTVSAMLVYAGSRKARPLAEVAPDFPPRLAAVVDRALAFDRADRFADAKAMQQALADAFQKTFGASVENAPIALDVAPTPPHVSLPGADALAPTVDSGHALPASATGPRQAAVQSMAGVSTGRRERRPRVPIAWLAAGAVACVAVAYGIFAFTRPQNAIPQPQVAASSAPTSSLAAPSATAAAPSTIATSTTAETATSAPQAVVVRPTRQVPSAKASTSAVLVHTAAPTSQTLDCDPPYTIDTQGHRIPKPGCY